MVENSLQDIDCVEDLVKAAYYWKDRDPKKYKAMLAKLRRERKKPGSRERSFQQVLQAKRREKGGPGTKAGQNGKKGHSSGHMKSDTATAVKRYQTKEKKAGTKLSIDRKDNNKGYDGKNTRLVPQKLNQGRHNIDAKKLKSWKSNLKKYNINDEMLKTLLKSMAYRKGMEDLVEHIENLDFEQLLKS